MQEREAEIGNMTTECFSMARGTKTISEAWGNEEPQLHPYAASQHRHACTTKPMRIAHVTRQFTPAVGGLENVVHNLARAQLSGGHQVRVITLNRDFARPDLVLPARENIEGIDVVRLPYRGSRRYPIAPTVLRHIKGAETSCTCMRSTSSSISWR